MTATNALSIDVEGFVESNMQSFPIPPRYIDEDREKFEIERNVDACLELLDELGIFATFFFVGSVPRRIPHLVEIVAKAGHEIASHSYEHVRLFDLDRNEFREGVRSSKQRLEDLCGKGVYGFRAPDFSITLSSMWAIDILREVGFAYDSSIYPIGMHDVYGVRGADPFISLLPNGLVEFPLSTIELFGKRIPVGGGGYFRLYPLSVTRSCISHINRSGHPCMFYVHPYEVGPVIPKIRELSAYRRFRHYYRSKNGATRLRRVLRGFGFAPAIEVLREQRMVEE
jgi:polysaccharide deacetylase family protein (PEP-CTERM system associated)